MAVVVYSLQCEMYVMTDLQIQTGQDEERKGGGGRGMSSTLCPLAPSCCRASPSRSPPYLHRMEKGTKSGQ